MNSKDSSEANFQRREQELRAREQEIRLKELELEIQRLDDPPDPPVREADYSETRKHDEPEKQGFWKQLSRNTKRTVQFMAVVILAVVVVRLANFLMGLVMVTLIAAIAYFFLFKGDS